MDPSSADDLAAVIGAFYPGDLPAGASFDPVDAEQGAVTTSAGEDYAKTPLQGCQGQLQDAAGCIAFAGTDPPLWDRRSAVEAQQRRDRRNPKESSGGLSPIQRQDACPRGDRRGCRAAVCAPLRQADARM